MIWIHFDPGTDKREPGIDRFVPLHRCTNIITAHHSELIQRFFRRDSLFHHRVVFSNSITLVIVHNIGKVHIHHADLFALVYKDRARLRVCQHCQHFAGLHAELRIVSEPGNLTWAVMVSQILCAPATLLDDFSPALLNIFVFRYGNQLCILRNLKMENHIDFMAVFVDIWHCRYGCKIPCFADGHDIMTREYIFI